MISKIAQPLQVNSTLSTLLDELGEECENVLSLLSQLKLSKLTDDKKAIFSLNSLGLFVISMFILKISQS